MMALQRSSWTLWNWRESGGQTYKGQSEIPTNIHLDLLAAGFIPDPFIGRNEASLQWIHDETWVYSTSFPVEEVGEHERIDLVLDGLDTFATVKLNGTLVLQTDNMFHSHRIDIKDLIRDENQLELTFEPAYTKSEALRAEKGHLLCWNGHYGRVYVRKAQYHFGWDWGPSFVTCGPWKPISIERYTHRIESINVQTDLLDDLREAKISVNAEIDSRLTSGIIEISLLDPDGKILELQSGDSTEATFSVRNPRLWWPHTHGDQPMYQIKVYLRSTDNEVLHQKSQTIGVRKIELMQEPLSEGSTFYFKCNQVPMFMGGSNWIPGDSFLPRMTEERYKRWINLAIQGNQNMLRVWGGGIYESDAFYDECDRRGMMVWQDFCFACGQYPWDSDFVASVREEAKQAVKRLRCHPSLVIWAGNNEDYQIANEGLGHDMKMPEEEWTKSSFGARLTYEKILPEIVDEFSPGIIYWPGSPFGGVDNNSDKTIGDIHIWNVSSGMLLPYQRYPDITGRFVSEFGMLSCPSLETITEAFFGDSKDRHPQSQEFEFHCKASSYEKRMFTCMGENFRMSFDLETYVYLSQLLQSEAMYYAYRGWRRQFEGRQCGGALVWQTNDTWPAVSWAIIDYYERPKMAYYTISRALKPIATGISRVPKVNPRPNLQHEAFCKGKTKADAAKVIAHATPHIYPPKESTYTVWVANSGTTIRDLQVRVRFVSIESGSELETPNVYPVRAKAVGTTGVTSGSTPETDPTVVVSEVFDSKGTLLSHDVDWPQPLKHLSFPDRGLKVEMCGKDEIVVSVKKPVKGLFFTNPGVEWSDNCIDVVPGQDHIIRVSGLNEPPRWTYYGIE